MLLLSSVCMTGSIIARYAIQESTRLHGSMIIGSLPKGLQLRAFWRLALRESCSGLQFEFVVQQRVNFMGV